MRAAQCRLSSALAFSMVRQMKQKERIKRHHKAALEAERKRVRAEQESHMKSAFLSNMSQYVSPKAAHPIRHCV
jgi:hypothetical protein